MSPAWTVKSSAWETGRDRVGDLSGTGEWSWGGGRGWTTTQGWCPVGSHRVATAPVVLSHLGGQFVQLQAALADDLDPEVAGVFRG